MTKKIKIASVQMNVIFDNKEANYNKAFQLLKRAKEGGAEVALLPETWDWGFFPQDNLLSKADEYALEAKAFLSGVARSLQMAIVGGSVRSKREDKLYNTSLVFDKNGHLLAEYDKTHLFSPMGENKVFTPGDHLSIFELNGVKCSVILCYDLRFPELSRSLFLKGVKVLFVASEWPLERLEQLLSLAKARAIENEMYIVLSSSSGEKEGLLFSGHSRIIAPSGEIVASLENRDEKIVEALCDIERVDNMRRNLPVLQDRRPELYN